MPIKDAPVISHRYRPASLHSLHPLESLRVGDVFWGRITHIKEFGTVMLAFVDFGSIQQGAFKIERTRSCDFESYYRTLMQQEALVQVKIVGKSSASSLFEKRRIDLVPTARPRDAYTDLRLSSPYVVTSEGIVPTHLLPESPTDLESIELGEGKTQGAHVISQDHIGMSHPLLTPTGFYDFVGQVYKETRNGQPVEMTLGQIVTGLPLFNTALGCIEWEILHSSHPNWPIGTMRVNSLQDNCLLEGKKVLLNLSAFAQLQRVGSFEDVFRHASLGQLSFLLRTQESLDVKKLFEPSRKTTTAEKMEEIVGIMTRDQDGARTRLSEYRDKLVCKLQKGQQSFDLLLDDLFMYRTELGGGIGNIVLDRLLSGYDKYFQGDIRKYIFYISDKIQSVVQVNSLEGIKYDVTISPTTKDSNLLFLLRVADHLNVVDLSYTWVSRSIIEELQKRMPNVTFIFDSHIVPLGDPVNIE